MSEEGYKPSEEEIQGAEDGAVSNSANELLQQIGELINKGKQDLLRMTKGEITEIELDNLYKVRDEKIASLRQLFLKSQEAVISEPADSGEEKEETSSLHRKLEGDELYADRIQSAPDLRNLINFINELGDITSADGYVYKKEDIINTIVNITGSNDPNLERITRTHGLRNSVKKLLVKRELGI